MTRQIAKSKDLARNRDNQRRSRQRRVDYVQSLESRLQQYEAAGVRASKEIQNAAKLVVQENVLLRDLLYSLGQTETDIKAYLKSVPLAADQTIDMRNADVLVPETNSGTKSVGAMHVGASGSCPHRRSDDQAPKTTETACEEAARIIAGMRGVPESGDLWSELGCNETQSCNISNTKLFQLMDQ